MKRQGVIITIVLLVFAGTGYFLYKFLKGGGNITSTDPATGKQVINVSFGSKDTNKRSGGGISMEEEENKTWAGGINTSGSSGSSGTYGINF